MKAGGLITSSRIASWLRCQRHHLLRYELGYVPLAVTIAALAVGSLLHLGLEAWWGLGLADLWVTWGLGGTRLQKRGAEAGLSFEEILAEVEHVSQPHRLAAALYAMRIAPLADPFEQARAEELMIAYHARWAHEELEVLGVELSFEAPLTHPISGARSRLWRLGGKVDAIARRPDGSVVLIEHKTSSEDLRQGAAFWQRLRMASQPSIYFEGARVLGHDPEACVYDVLAKPRIWPQKATPEDKRKYRKDGALYSGQRERDETLEEYRARLRAELAEDPERWFQRFEAVRLERDLQEHRWDVWSIAEQMRGEQRSDERWSPRNPTGCHRFGRPCEYFDVCTGAASLSDPTRYQRLDDVHPELNEEAADAAEATP
jgi:hypothetical protein